MGRARRQSSAHTSREHPSKKQKTAGSNGLKLADFFNSTIEKILALSDDGDYRISIDFSTLPDKSQYPEYYEEIESPISIQEIKDKVASGSYGSVDEFLDDFKLMSDNAIQFNEADSDIAQNSLTILETARNAASANAEQLGSAAETSSPVAKATPRIKIRLPQSKQEPTQNDKFSQIIKQLIEFQDNGVDVAEPFLYEVDREEYPDYYVLIKEAMSLTTVQASIKENRYTTIDQFVQDVDLIWKNAQTYNEEGSLIYEDSRTLEDFFHSKIDELKSAALKIEEQKEKEEEPKEPPQPLKEEKQVKLPEPTVPETPVETPVKKKLGRPKGRPPKPKVPIIPVVPTEPEDILSLELGENLLESNLLGDLEEPTRFIPPVTLIPYKKEEPVILDSIEAIPKLLETFSKIPEHTPATNDLIQELTISSSRSVYRSTVKANQPQIGNIFQNWFEYQFEARSKKPDSYSITLLPSVQGAVSVSAGLNDSLLKRKHQAFLTVNGEKVNPTPSIHYADTGRQLTSRYELKLASGLNRVVFEISTEGQGSYDDLFTESLTVWVQVL